MPKPTEEIMAWIGTLAPPDELAVRLAMYLHNPWCHEDGGWQTRVAALEAKLVKSPADRTRYDKRAVEMARNMEAAIETIKAQAATPAPAPTEPPLR